MKHGLAIVCAGLWMCTAILSLQAQTASPRFEVSSIKAIRPKLVNLVSALKKQDAAAGKAAFEAYDAAWNGIEVYINYRSLDTYTFIEHTHGDKVEKGLEEASPNFASLTADAEAMLQKFDETVAMIEKAPPVSPLFDDIARLRIVRAKLRPVNAELKSGDMGKSREGFAAFHHDWTTVEGIIRQRSAESDDAINKGLADVEAALKQDKPNVEQVTSLLNAATLKYNTVLGQINRDARAAK